MSHKRNGFVEEAMLRDLFAICCVAVIGAALFMAGPSATVRTATITPESVKAKSSLTIPQFEYEGFANYNGELTHIRGAMPAVSARAALALALQLEYYVALQVRLHTVDPYNAPAIVDGLIYWYPQWDFWYLPKREGA